MYQSTPWIIDSEYLSYTGIDRTGANFIGNKQTYAQLYILVQMGPWLVWIINRN